MAHRIAKLLLEKAGTFLERTQAIKEALGLGMPLNEIQEYLDWLDFVGESNAPPSNDRGQANTDDKQDDEGDANPGAASA